MARLFQAGGELGHYLAERFEVFTAAGTLAVDTSTKRSGSGSYKLDASANRNHLHRVLGAVAGRTYYLRAYVRFASFPAAETYVVAFSNSTVAATAGSVVGGIKVSSGGVATLDTDAVGALGGTLSLSLNTWYCFEVSAVISGGVVTCNGRIDGNALTAPATFTTGTGPLAISARLVQRDPGQRQRLHRRRRGQRQPERSQRHLAGRGLRTGPAARGRFRCRRELGQGRWQHGYLRQRLPVGRQRAAGRRSTPGKRRSAARQHGRQRDQRSRRRGPVLRRGGHRRRRHDPLHERPRLSCARDGVGGCPRRNPAGGFQSG